MSTSLEDQHTSDKQSKHDEVIVSTAQVDDGAQYVFDNDEEVDPVAADAVRKKIDWHILPLMMVLYAVQFIDKTTLGNSANLGIKTTAHLDANEYNWLGTIFYLSYLIFEYPQNLALQRFPVGRWMSGNILVWGIALSCHAACHSFGALFALRFILGACEGAITAGFLIVTSMFYTHKEQSVRVGWWFLMNGTAQIVAGFVSFGVLHIKNTPLAPWQWYMLITGIITLMVAAAYFFLFPNNPQTAWFLTPEEKKIAIKRIKSNQSGVENKVFKREQVMEALTDPKTWLFALFSCLDNIPNSLTNQRSIIVKSFGFSTLQTTLLGCVDGVIEIVTIWTAVSLVARIPRSRAYIGAVWFIPNILGSILVIALPWSNKIGLLFSVWITGVGTSGFVLSLGWVTAVTAGHTKRVTVNAIMLSAYCVGNLVGPQMWQEKFTPRNYVPWGIILACYSICPLILLYLRFLLNRDNHRREAEASMMSSSPSHSPSDKGSESEEGAYVVEEKDGRQVKRLVDKGFLDMTDIENRDFRYVL